MSAELDLARQWVAKARGDLLNADNNLASSRVPADTVCFHCQQAVEKLLKAVLAAHGVPPPRTHILLVLAEMIAPLLPQVMVLREAFVNLTPYAVAARYPGDGGDAPTLEDAREARDSAQEVVLWLSEAMPALWTEDGP